MKKLLCFVLCAVIFGVLSITCSAQSVDISLKAEKSGRSGVNAGVILRSDDMISGGVFVVTFDDSVVSFKDVSSDYFEVDAQHSGSNVEVVIATEKSVNIADGVKAFSVKFSTVSESSFDISVEAKSLVNDNLGKFTPDISNVNYTVDVTSDAVEKTKNVTDKGINNKTASKTDNKSGNKSQSGETSKKTVTKKSISKISADENNVSTVASTKSGDESTFLKVGNPQNRHLILIIFLCVIVVAAFALGLVCRKCFFEKKDKI